MRPITASTPVLPPAPRPPLTPIRPIAASDKHSEPSSWTLQQAFQQASCISWREKASGKKLIRNGEMVVEFFGHQTPLSSITCSHIDDFISYLRSIGNQNGTINRKLAALSKLFTVAEKRGGVALPRPHIERRREKSVGGRIRFLSRPEECASLSVLTEWGHHDAADALTVLVDTGIRPSELWRLEGRDYNTESHILSVWQTKADLPRSIPATTRVRHILMRRLLLQRSPRANGQASPPLLLFPYTNAWFEVIWNRMRAHLHLEGDAQFIPYALRHTCASRLIQRRVPLKVVQEWLGHKSIHTTLRYAHLCPSNLLDAVRVLEDDGGPSIDATCSWDNRAYTHTSPIHPL